MLQTAVCLGAGLAWSRRQRPIQEAPLDPGVKLDRRRQQGMLHQVTLRLVEQPHCLGVEPRHQVQMEVFAITT